MQKFLWVDEVLIKYSNHLQMQLMLLEMNIFPSFGSLLHNFISVKGFRLNGSIFRSRECFDKIISVADTKQPFRALSSTGTCSRDGKTEWSITWESWLDLCLVWKHFSWVCKVIETSSVLFSLRALRLIASEDGEVGWNNARSKFVWKFTQNPLRVPPEIKL